VIKSPCRHSVLDLSLPRTRYGGIQCFQAVIDSALIFIGVTRRNDVRGSFSKVSYFITCYARFFWVISSMIPACCVIFDIGHRFLYTELRRMEAATKTNSCFE
jgi:hypothetical protein